MRFESVHIRRYGCLEDVEIGTPATALPAIVVVFGPNESGKSTFFSFLTTLLYGFHPAKRTTNPYTPWLGEDPPEGRARFRLDDGEVQEIHRRLLAAPWGKLKTSGYTKQVFNKPLPHVAALDHVPQKVFEQVYALTLSELSGLEGKSWDLVQAKLVGSMGADLQPAGKVVSEFQDEAKKLWKPNKVGKPLFKTLQAELTALNDRRQDALHRDHILRKKMNEKTDAETESKALGEKQKRERERRTALHYRLNVLLPVRKKRSKIAALQDRAGSDEELDKLPQDPETYRENLRSGRNKTEARIGDLGREAERCRAVIQGYEREHPNINVLAHRLNVLLPVRKALSQIKDLRVRAGPDDELSALPEDPKGYLDRLRERHGLAKARVAELDQEAVSCRQEIATSERALQEVATVAQEVSAAAGRLVDLTRKVKEAERRADELNVRCREHARDLLSVACEQVDWSHVSAVPVGKLEEGVRKYQRISKQRVDDEDSGPQDGALRPGWGRLVVAGVAFVFGLLLLPAIGLPVPLDDVFAWALGGSAVIVGFFLGTRWRVEVRRANRASARWSERVATVKSEEEAARDEVGELVGKLPIHAWLLEPPSFNLLLERVRRMVELSNDLAESKLGVARRRKSLDDRTSKLRERMADEIRKLRETTTVPFHEDLRAQANALQEAARAIQEKINVTKMNLAKIEADNGKATHELGETANKFRAFTGKLASFGEGSVDRGLREVVKRLEARHRASQLEEELKRNYSNLNQLVAQIQKDENDGETWDTLKERLELGREAGDKAKTAQGKLEMIESQEEEAREELRTSTEELRALEKKLASFVGGSVDRGLKEVSKRLDARHLASQLDDELARDPDLDELVAQIQKAEADGETWDSLEEELTVLKESLREMDKRFLEQNGAIAKLGAEIDSIQKEETANQVQGEIEIVEAQILDAKESRDRLFLLAILVQEADRRFREMHQPALLKQAGKYVDQITGGRYDRIVIGETGDKFFSLRDRANSPLRKMSDPYSQGTKEQIYFALRLAAIDYLDGDQERLPLFLDEVFVNWDPQRLSRAFELVEQVARQRQVFFFTCHEAMATRLGDSGGMIVDLS